MNSRTRPYVLCLRSRKHWSPVQAPITGTLAHRTLKEKMIGASTKLFQERKYVLGNNEYWKINYQ